MLVVMDGTSLPDVPFLTHRPIFRAALARFCRLRLSRAASCPQTFLKPPGLTEAARRDRIHAVLPVDPAGWLVAEPGAMTQQFRGTALLCPGHPRSHSDEHDEPGTTNDGEKNGVGINHEGHEEYDARRRNGTFKVREAQEKSYPTTSACAPIPESGQATHRHPATPSFQVPARQYRRRCLPSFCR